MAGLRGVARPYVAPMKRLDFFDSAVISEQRKALP